MELPTQTNGHGLLLVVAINGDGGRAAFAVEHAIELAAISDEIAIADVKIETLGDADRNADHSLIREHGVVVMDRDWASDSAEIETRSADTSADVRLDAAATIEIVEAVQHARPDVNVAVVENASAEVVEAMAQLTFDTEVVLHGVAQTQMLGPIIVQVQVVGAQINSTVRRVTDVGAAIPSFSGVGGSSARSHHSGQRDRLGDARFHIHPSQAKSPATSPSERRVSCAFFCRRPKRPPQLTTDVNSCSQL